MASSAAALSALRYGDGLVIVGISAATAVLCEAISWLLIYRTASYLSLRSTIDSSSRKLDSLKSSAAARAKKIDRVKTQLKESSRDLSLAKFKSGAVVAAVLFVIFDLLNSLFEGRAVAKLPFEQVALVRKISHRGLPGTDPTDCSMAFLSSLSIRTNLQKFLGFALSRAAAGTGGLARQRSDRTSHGNDAARCTGSSSAAHGSLIEPSVVPTTPSSCPAVDARRPSSAPLRIASHPLSVRSPQPVHPTASAASPPAAVAPLHHLLPASENAGSAAAAASAPSLHRRATLKP